MSSFLQSASWLGTAELFNRVMRLGTTVVVSRALSFEDYISIPFFLRWVHRLDILSFHPTEVCS